MVTPGEKLTHAFPLNQDGKQRSPGLNPAAEGGHRPAQRRQQGLACPKSFLSGQAPLVKCGQTKYTTYRRSGAFLGKSRNTQLKLLWNDYAPRDSGKPVRYAQPTPCPVNRLKAQRRDSNFETVMLNVVASSSRFRMQISLFPFSKSEMKLRSMPTCSAM